MVLPLLIYGLINGSILALTALGFSLTYGISRVANFAYGALYVLAGFSAWFFLNRLHLNYFLSLLLSILLTGLIGAALYRIALIRVRGMPTSEIIVTFALGTALLETLRFFGFLGSHYTLPAFYSGALPILGVPVDYQRLFIVILGAVLFLGLWIFTHYAETGLALRAIAQDEQAAMMAGIDSDLIAALSLGLGAGLAALAAAILLPLSYLATESGSNILVYAIAVCIVGGLESTTGVLVASLLIGYAQMLSVIYLGPHYQMIVALVAILVTLILRPSGIFGKQKELEERV